MKLLSRLPPTRFVAGEFWVEDQQGRCIFGPLRARGEADNTGAATHDNPEEDPTQLYGDHPSGFYRVTAIAHPDPHRYGPAFLVLDPLEGEALEAKRTGRTGLGIHGGRLHADGRLRETFGCLRVDNATLDRVVELVTPELTAGRIVFYECVIAEGPFPFSTSNSGLGTSDIRKLT